MDNPLLKKANGFDTPATKSTDYSGFYPEAIGGGWNPRDGDDLMSDISKQLGGFAGGTRESKSTRDYIDGLYRSTQEPPAKSEGKKNHTLRELNASITDADVVALKAKHILGSLKKRALIMDDENSEYSKWKGESELEQVIRDNINELHHALKQAWKAKNLEAYGKAYDDIAALIEEYPVAREYAEKNMRGLGLLGFDGQPPHKRTEDKTKIRSCIRDGCGLPFDANLPETRDPRTLGLFWQRYCPKHRQGDGSPTITEQKPFNKLRAPRFKEDDKIRLHGLGVKGSLKAAWDKAIVAGALQFVANRYSFAKGASSDVRQILASTVIQVNGRLNRLHVPKNARAHEAAVKHIAKVARANNEKLDEVTKAVSKFAARSLPKWYYRQQKVKNKKYSEDDLNYLFDHFSNMFGDLNPKVRRRLARVINYPTTKNWDNAYSIIVDGKKFKTLWQAVIAVDPWFPKRGPSSDANGVLLKDWEKLPDQATLVKALLNVAGLNSMPKKPTLEEPFSNEDHEVMKSMGITGAKKPKCPHCGSTKFGLMPTDFETAKCDKCGKNWELGIVDGINNPDEKTAATGVKTAKAPDTFSLFNKVYKVEKRGTLWYVIGLPSEGFDDEIYPDSLIIPGMNHAMNTPESITQGIYEALYDEFQTNDNLQKGDIFDTPVGQFICEGVHVLPYDEKAKAAVAKVNEQYKCKTCGCDQGDHIREDEGYYGQCKTHRKCKEFVKNL